LQGFCGNYAKNPLDTWVEAWYTLENIRTCFVSKGDTSSVTSCHLPLEGKAWRVQIHPSADKMKLDFWLPLEAMSLN